MAYYIKYNNIDLTDKVKVRNIETTLTPPRENSTINIWERAGEIYNGYRWDNREITVSFLLLYTEEEYDNNPLILEEGLSDIRTCLNVSEPKELYLNDPDKFIYAIPNGDIEVNELRYNCAEITVTFICYNPFYYSEEAKQFDGTRLIEVTNEGDVPTEPIIKIGFSEASHFVQLENLNDKKKMLIGNLPLVSQTSVSEKTNVLTDECKGTAGWTTNTTYIDNDRATGGTLTTTEKNSGIMCGNFGSAGSTTWHGVSARKNLDSQVNDFEVEAFIEHLSSGVNGDPSKTIDMRDPEHRYEGSTVTGTRTEKYVVVCNVLNIRYGPGTSYKVVGTAKKGTEIKPLEWQGDWARIGTNRWVCCNRAYVEKRIMDSTSVTTAKKVNIYNYYTISSAEVRLKATKESKLVCTIPQGEIVRLIAKKIYQDNDHYFFEMENSWHGQKGYIDGTKVAVATDVSIEYPEEVETADDKTGILEIYGYDNNNVQLFKMSMIDDNQYYEFNQPLTKVGGATLLTDNTIAPEPKTKNDYNANESKLTVKKDYLLSGKYGTWTDFRGKIGIRRVNNYWQCWFVKMKGGQVVKQIFSENRKVKGAGTGELAYITIYMGTNGDKPCDMAINKLTVRNVRPETTNVGKNVKRFMPGDTLKVDCYNNRVWLNDKLYNNVEIGSQFFSLDKGVSTIKAVSDKSIHVSIVFNEKFL